MRRGETSKQKFRLKSVAEQKAWDKFQEERAHLTDGYMLEHVIEPSDDLQVLLGECISLMSREVRLLRTLRRPLNAPESRKLTDYARTIAIVGKDKRTVEQEDEFDDDEEEQILAEAENIKQRRKGLLLEEE